MEIYYRTLTGNNISLEVESSDTIRDVKARMHDEIRLDGKVQIQDQKLLMFQGQQLNDGLTLADYHIMDGDTLLLVFGMQITWRIHNGGMSRLLYAESSDTVEDVKAKIQWSLGVPPYKQKLFFAGRQLEDGSTVAECGIQNESNLDLELHLNRIYIFAKDLGGKIIFLEGLESYDTIGSVKDKIPYKDNPVWRLRLQFKGRQLEDAKTFAHYNIQTADTLFILVTL